VHIIEITLIVLVPPSLQLSTSRLQSHDQGRKCMSQPRTRQHVQDQGKPRQRGFQTEDWKKSTSRPRQTKAARVQEWRLEESTSRPRQTKAVRVQEWRLEEVYLKTKANQGSEGSRMKTGRCLPQDQGKPRQWGFKNEDWKKSTSRPKQTKAARVQEWRLEEVYLKAWTKAARVQEWRLKKVYLKTKANQGSEGSRIKTGRSLPQGMNWN